MIKIEKGIPIPPIKKRSQYRGGQGETEFTKTLREMEMGDSFLITLEKSTISAAFSRIRKETERNFTMRDQGDGIYRVWRIS